MELIELYLILNLIYSFFISTFTDIVPKTIEEMKKSIKLKHIFLILFNLVLFLPSMLLMLSIYLIYKIILIQSKQYKNIQLKINKILNKDLIVFKGNSDEYEVKK